MPLDLSTALREAIDSITGRTAIDLNHARAKLLEAESAINGLEASVTAFNTALGTLNGTVTFDSASATFPSKAAAQAATGISSSTFLALAGVRSPGDMPVTFFKQEASAATNDGASFQADGVHWHAFESNNVTEMAFDAVGDGVADDTTPFQNWIDWANAKDKSNLARNVILEPHSSEIRLTRPIWVSRSIGGGVSGPNELRGKRPFGQSRDENARGGTVLIKDFVGGILLIYHGARNFRIRNLAFENPNYDVSTHLAGDMRRITDPAVWDELVTEYATNPEMFIGIDPFYGAAPSSNPYVAGTGAGQIPLASWVNQTLYNTRAQTSEGTVENCYFQSNPGGPCVGVQVNQEANADFINFIGNHVEFSRWGFSQNSSQGRSSDVRDNIGGNFIDLVTTTVHGADTASGRINAHVSGNSVNKCRRLLSINDTAVGSAGTELDKNYVETGAEFARIEGGGAGESMLRITDCFLNLDPTVRHSGGINDQPGYVVKGNTAARVEIDGFHYSRTTWGVQAFEPKFARMTNGVATPEVLATVGDSEKEWLRILMSACLGFYFNVDSGQGLGPHDVKARAFDESTDAPTIAFGWANEFDNLSVTRDSLLPLWQWSFMLSAQRYGRRFNKFMMPPVGYRTVMSTTPTNTQVQVTIGNDRIETFKFADTMGDDHYAENQGGVPGDGIFDPMTGTLWGIFSRVVTGTAPNRTVTVKAYRINNFRETAPGAFGDFDQIVFNGANLTQNQGAWTAGSYAAGDTVQSSSNGRWYQTAGGGTAAGDDTALNSGSDTGISDWVQVQTSANLFVVNHRMFATDRMFQHDTVAGSPSITVYSPRVSTTDIAALDNANTGIQAGDRLFDHDEQDAMFTNDSNRIVDITDNSDGTATVQMAGNAARTETARPFLQFIRKPPASEATPT